MRFEAGTCLGNFCKLTQAEDLESPAVSEYGAIPVHESVQTAQFMDQLMAGEEAGYEMEWKNRCLECSVQGAHLSTAGCTLRGPGVQRKRRRLSSTVFHGI